MLCGRDTSTAWHEQAGSTRSERVYYCQNWRADVSAVLTDSGKMLEWIKYSAYGVPFALPAGDTNSDGAYDGTDHLTIINATQYDVRKDADLDGVVDGDDAAHAWSVAGGFQTLGRGVLSSTGVNNRRGYAGYEFDPTFQGADRWLYHVRHRVYDADAGRWTRRDPLGYVDGMSLYEYVRGRPVVATDAQGLYARRSFWLQLRVYNHNLAKAGLPTLHTNWARYILLQGRDRAMRPCPMTDCGSTLGLLRQPRRNEPRSDEECCRIARRDGHHRYRDDQGKRRTADGTVICCDGRKVSCSFYSQNRPLDCRGQFFADGCEKAHEIINQCIIQHENKHHGDVPECPQRQGVDRTRFAPGVDPDQAECEAYRIELSCLQAKLHLCNKFLDGTGYTPETVPDRGRFPPGLGIDRARALRNYHECRRRIQDQIDKSPFQKEKPGVTACR